jgi:hypothetical protein
MRTGATLAETICEDLCESGVKRLFGRLSGS